MAQPVDAWWQRKQRSRDADVPYAPGTYADAWAPYPVLVRQYRPESNAGILLSQIPPAAEVLLLWRCEVGHEFAATPTEQRNRPGRERRRSSWCPECSAAAKPAVIRSRDAPPRSRRPSKPVCPKTPDLPVGEAFVSGCAPKPASAAEARLRQLLHERLEFTDGVNAVRVARPFHSHLEVWPDIVIPELRVAIEYDTTGRHGLEHVGRREESDRRKDRILRSARWEVVRVRTGGLQPLGPHDVHAAGVSARLADELLETLAGVCGELMLAAYRR